MKISKPFNCGISFFFPKNILDSILDIFCVNVPTQINILMHLY